jgi:hypothetical protein
MSKLVLARWSTGMALLCKNRRTCNAMLSRMHVQYFIAKIESSSRVGLEKVKKKYKKQKKKQQQHGIA